MQSNRSTRTFPLPRKVRKPLARMLPREFVFWLTHQQQQLEDFGRFALAWRTGREMRGSNTRTDTRYEQFFTDASDLDHGLTELIQQAETRAQDIEEMSECLAEVLQEAQNEQRTLATLPYHVRAQWAYTLCSATLAHCLQLLPTDAADLAGACLDTLQQGFEERPSEPAFDMRLYQGWRAPESKNVVRVNGEPLVLIVAHEESVAGWDWGNTGPAAADLALSILTDFLGVQGKADQLHQAFLQDVHVGIHHQ